MTSDQSTVGFAPKVRHKKWTPEDVAKHEAKLATIAELKRRQEVVRKREVRQKNYRNCMWCVKHSLLCQY